MKHNTKVVEAFFRAHGIPSPETEFKFHPTRKWRFDYAWDFGEHDFDWTHKVYVEVEGGVWIGGRHTSGSGFVKDMEKHNEAACLGWRMLRCQPKELLTTQFANTIKRALGI